MKTRDLVLMSLFAALLAAGSYIKIPLPVCPITFQPLFAALAGLILGGKRGAASVCCFLFIGLLGLPVFTGGGGFWYVFKPTFGFLAGYIFQAYITGSIAHSGRLTSCRLIFAGFAGLVTMYIIGLIYFWLISHYYLGTSLTVKGLIVSCFLIPFPKDAIMCVMAAFFAKRIIPIISHEQRRASI